MLLLFPILLFMNGITEYLLIKMMMATAVPERRNGIFHVACTVLRIAWVFLGAWFAFPMPLLLIGLFVLLFFNVIPYRKHRILMNNFIMMIYLIFTTLLMMVIGIASLLGFNVAYMVQNTITRVIILNVTFMLFNIVCILLLSYHPQFLWREDYDKSKVLIYTQFLFICAIYHILDAIILTSYMADRVSYLVSVSGDILIFILIFHFLNYNYVFEKSEEMRREYEESEVMLAQQYFEKESLKKLSENDSLTNAYNRREISSLMLKSIKSGHQLACVFVDLDGLKQTNDTYGHSFGDLMLKRFADACTEMLHEKGYLARIGGDEFLLIFLDRNISDIEACIKALQLKLLNPKDEKERISFSYGISYGEEAVDDYILLADQRMYADKNRKRRGNI